MYLEIWSHRVIPPNQKAQMQGGTRREHPDIWFAIADDDGKILRARFIASNINFEQAKRILRPRLGYYLLDVLCDIELGSVEGVEGTRGGMLELWIRADEQFPHSPQTTRRLVSINLEQPLGEVLEDLLCPHSC